MVTLNDIAKIANVSKSTVSRYLNNGSISQKTKDKLDKIVKENNYRPNIIAQNLKAVKSNMLGVILPRYDSPSTNQVLKGIDSVAYEKDIQLVLMNSNLDIRRTKHNLSLLQRQKVGAIILFAAEVDDELKKEITMSKIPVIVVGQEISDNVSFIFDDYEAGRVVGEHAIAYGHKHLLYVGVNDLDNAVGLLRKKGFYEAASQEGVKIDFIETEFSKSFNYNLALEYLPKTKATFIAAATDHIAIGISNASSKLGLEIPADFSLSGFGGYGVTQNVFPHITTVNYPFYEMGKLLADEILKMMDSDQYIIKELIKLPVELNVQGSSGRCSQANAKLTTTKKN